MGTHYISSLLALAYNIVHLSAFRTVAKLQTKVCEFNLELH